MLLIISLDSRTELQILKRTDDNSLAWDMEKTTLGEKTLKNREEQVDSEREDRETSRERTVNDRLQEDRLLGIILQEHEEKKQVRRMGKFLKKNVTG